MPNSPVRSKLTHDQGFERPLDDHSDMAKLAAPFKERCDSDFVRGVEGCGGSAALAHGLTRQPHAGSASSAWFNVREPSFARSSFGAGVSRRWGQVRARAIGSRMSGAEAASTSSRRHILPGAHDRLRVNKDIEWLGERPNRCWASISSRPLFIIVAELMVIFCPYDQLGCLSACSRVGASDPLPPARCGTARPTRSGSHARPGARLRGSSACITAECSLSTVTRFGPMVANGRHEEATGTDQAFLVGERDAAALRLPRSASAPAGNADDAGQRAVGRPPLPPYHAASASGGGFDAGARQFDFSVA